MYLAGVKTKATIVPDVLLNRLSNDRRTFVNDATNPTTSTQNDIFLEATKTVIALSTGMWNMGGSSESQDNMSFYALATFNHHNKQRKPKNNGKNGKYLAIQKSSLGGYKVYDNWVYDVKQYIDISGGHIQESGYPGYYYYEWMMDSSHDFSAYNTDTIFTSNTDICKVWKDGDSANKTTVSTPCMNSICVMESKLEEAPIFKMMSSGVMWTNYTGCIQYENFHNWTYKYQNINLPDSANGPGAQCYGEIIKGKTSSTDRTYQARNSYNTPSTATCPLTYLGPLVNSIRGTDFIVEDISNLVNKPLNYYSGLPLIDFTADGKLSFTLAFDWSSIGDTIVAIRDTPFDNSDILSENTTKDLFWKKYSVSDLSEGTVDITIEQKKLEKSKGKTLYIKCCNVNGTGNSWVRIYVDKCKIETV